MAGLAIYRTRIAPEWIDYNGHLRDAYYVLIASLAVDALMERIGIDARYREESHCTLYTLEMHIHYLREIGAEDALEVLARILGADGKRIHLALELVREEGRQAAATCEMMLLHVHQGATVRAAAFPEGVAAAIAELRHATGALSADGPGSRRIELRAR
ncbi:MAG TPA: thioesterase family protein [Steroidobacteraceae bacterium]|nr:thioesterase family protein [Steroidobacteraceae bacterium]